MLEQIYQLLLKGEDPRFILELLNNSTFDEIVEINVEENTCTNIYHVDGKYFVPLLIATFEDLFAFCTDNMIHPSDRTKFVSLMDPKTIMDRLENSRTKGFLFSQFRYKLQDGGWRWTEQCVIGGERFNLPKNVIRFYVFDIQNKMNYASGSSTERKTSENHRDKRTTLLNDSAFFAEAQKFIDGLKKPEEWCFMSIDIEHFRLFNDWYGHKKGDFLLSTIGLKLSEYEKEYSGIAGYIGQDDFSMVMKNDPKLINQLYDDIYKIIDSFGSAFGFSPVFGICGLDISTMTTELFDLASVANFAAKHVQKRHICYYSSKMREETEREYKVLSDFKDALANHEITFYLQPQIRIDNRKIISGESLARWIKPDGKLVMPGDFIPVLEKYGFIVDLDQYIWREVFAWQRKWINSGHKPVPLALNVSQVDIRSIDVAEYLKQLTEEFDLAPSLFKVEVTESACVDSAANGRETIAKLHKYGFKVLMDDFGSGYSSLNSLSTIDMDAIKLDALFLGLYDQDDSKAAQILKSIINMNKSIGIPMVIEGVENEKHVEFLQEMGCKYAQGYYFYRPVPIKEFEAIISNENNIDDKGMVFETNE